MTRKVLLTLVFSMVLTVLIQGQGQGETRETGDIATFDLPGGATIEMVWIEPGTFLMGHEGDQHEVTLTRGFYLGKYELTQGQWESVMDTSLWSGQDSVQANPSHPAVYISWNDMQEFIGKLNQAEGTAVYRLPTEAEWEFTCRAGTTTKWSFGDDEGDLGNYAWERDNAQNAGEQYVHAVGTKLPNPWGLYDMHGNVFEWCQDRYWVYSSNAQVDPTGSSSGSFRVLRGGAFDYGAFFTRAANRYAYSPDSRNYSFGARLLRQEP